MFFATLYDTMVPFYGTMENKTLEDLVAMVHECLLVIINASV